MSNLGTTTVVKPKSNLLVVAGAFTVLPQVVGLYEESWAHNLYLPCAVVILLMITTRYLLDIQTDTEEVKMKSVDVNRLPSAAQVACRPTTFEEADPSSKSSEVFRNPPKFSTDKTSPFVKVEKIQHKNYTETVYHLTPEMKKALTLRRGLPKGRP